MKKTTTKTATTTNPEVQPTPQPLKYAPANYKVIDDTERASKYWFALVDGCPIPKRYEDCENEISSGFETVNLSEAAHRTGLPESHWKALWHTMLEPLGTPEPVKEISPFERGDYFPEIADWCLSGDENRRFLIVPGGATLHGDYIAEIKINPVLNEKSQARLARFLASAPELWQTLRGALNTIMEANETEYFADAISTLRHACGRQPIEFVTNPQDEKNVFEQHNKATHRLVAAAVAPKDDLPASETVWNGPRESLATLMKKHCPQPETEQPY